jgi:hypothetical protein
MRHRDRVFDVPLTLDEHGFRDQITRALSGPYVDVVFLGGRSMMFGYGLEDYDTIPGQVALKSSYKIRAVNVAWPGFDLLRSYHAYQALLEGEVQPAVVVLSLYGSEFHDWVRADFALAPAQGQEQLFRFQQGLVLQPRGIAAKLFGPWYYRSFLLHKSARVLDFGAKRGFPQVLEEPGTRAPKGEGVSANIAKVNLSVFIEHIRDYFAGRGAKVLVAFLPYLGGDELRAEFYRDGPALLPDTARHIDLHRRLLESGGPFETIGHGHYARETSHAIAGLLALEIDALLDERSHMPRRGVVPSRSRVVSRSPANRCSAHR